MASDFARERGVDELTAMHGWILGYLCRNEHKDIFQKDIEAEFKICRSTVTNILKLMEKKGYIKRESVPYDARLKKPLDRTGANFASGCEFNIPAESPIMLWIIPEDEINNNAGITPDDNNEIVEIPKG